MLTDTNLTSRAQGQLDFSNQCYRHLLVNMEQGFCLIEIIYDEAGQAVDYRFLEANRAFERHTGIRNAVGRTAFEAVPNLEAQWVKTYARVAQTGEAFAFEQGSLAMGRLFKVDAVGIGEAGSHRVALIFSDITDRRRTELNLIKGEERLRIALEAVLYSMLGVHPSTSSASYEVWALRVFPADLVEVKAMFAESLKAGGEYHAEYRVLGQRDEIRWVAAHGRANCDVEGNVIRSYGVMTDVTERNRVAEDIRRSETRYRRLFECAHDGVVILDADTRKIIDANPFMTKLLGYEHAELVGKELYEIGLLKDEAASREMIAELNRTNQIRYEDLPLESRTGRHQEVEVIANMYTEGERTVIQCNIRDITERKRAEEHVNMLMAEVNHRAKNLLAVVQAVANQTAKEGSPATFSARLSERIVALAAGQDLLVRNHWQGVELSELIASQLDHFKDLIGTRVLLDGPAAQLTPDAAQGIGMALHELGTNAAKYGALSNGEGRVLIGWRITGDVAPQFSMSWLERGGPKVVAPTRAGFGHTVIGRMAQASVQGAAEIKFAETGLLWSLSAPAENVLTKSAMGKS
ncbi:MAG: PAS domain S-box protein [Hyphomonadaceae bacterium]|nr:PAS domain S-box protein [Hyphomonadaceae bacterium]